MYVYKITNNINNKIYIGITNNYKKRWDNEKSYPKNPERRQVIQEAIHKYGKNNFSFEVLFSHLSIEEACEKEIQLIQEYNCLVPNGYNVDKGGRNIKIGNAKKGIVNSNSKLTEEDVKYIKSHRNIPMLVLYDDFSDKITYETFKKCYRHETYKDIEPTVEQYPYNLEFSSQFNSSTLEYDEVVELRLMYNRGVYWRTIYPAYQERYPNEWDFWNIYNGNRYKLVMPEVFTEENKKIHSKHSKSGELNGRAKLTKQDVIEIRRLHEEEKLSNQELYKLYPQVSTVSIRNVINYKTWNNL